MKTLMTSVAFNFDAHETIRNFFSRFHLREAVQAVHQLTKWAGKDKCYSKRTPAHLLYFTKELSGLCLAADYISTV